MSKHNIKIDNLGIAQAKVNNKLLNITCNNNNYKDFVSYLIKNNYKLYFTEEYIDTKLMTVLLNNNYNMPFISNTKEFKLTTLELVYTPDIKTINKDYIIYMINEYNKGDKVPCKAYGDFDKETLKFFYKSINDPKSNEISGKLNMSNTHVKEKLDKAGNIVFTIKKIESNNGESVEAEQVESRYNFHTHPVNAYIHYNCDLGWPSRDDYIIIIESFLKKKNSTVFHWLCTKEGIYVLSIPEESVLIYQKLKDVKTEKIEKYIEKNLEIDKLNFKKSIGINIKNFGKINDVYSYIDYINKSQKDNPFSIKYKGTTYNLKLINIQFFDWYGNLGLLSNLDIQFVFYYPKVGGNCLIMEEHIR